MEPPIVTESLRKLARSIVARVIVKERAAKSAEDMDALAEEVARDIAFEVEREAAQACSDAVDLANEVRKAGL